MTLQRSMCGYDVMVLLTFYRFSTGRRLTCRRPYLGIRGDTVDTEDTGYDHYPSSPSFPSVPARPLSIPRRPTAHNNTDLPDDRENEYDTLT